MFESSYIKLENGKKIKLLDLEIEIVESISSEEDETMVAIMYLDPIYTGYFNSQETSISSVFFKKWFKKSRELYLNQDSVSSFKVSNGKLIISQELERI